MKFLKNIAPLLVAAGVETAQAQTLSSEYFNSLARSGADKNSITLRTVGSVTGVALTVFLIGYLADERLMGGRKK